MEQLTSNEIRLVLAQSRLGHLGLASEGRAYVIPIFFAYDGKAIYFHSHPGVKELYIAGTQEACLAVTRATSEDQWENVLVFGRVAPVQLAADKLSAMDALMSVPLPPELGWSESGEPARTNHALRTWKIQPTKMTGRKSVRPHWEAAADIVEVT